MGEDPVMARFTIEDEIPASSSGFTIDDAPEARQSLTPEQISRASGAELPSPAQGFVTAMQGPLFGFLDEMTGAVQGIKSAATGGGFRPGLYCWTVDSFSQLRRSAPRSVCRLPGPHTRRSQRGWGASAGGLAGPGHPSGLNSGASRRVGRRTWGLVVS